MLIYFFEETMILNKYQNIKTTSCKEVYNLKSIKMKSYRKAVEELISETGITINGNQSFDIQVYNKKFYKRVLQNGSLGLGESYMEGWWDCEDLDVFFYKMFSHELENKIKNNWGVRSLVLKAKLMNLQSKSKALDAISHHYDIGNDLYEEMLDPLMMYSCAYWKDTNSLPEAQEQKLKLICEKLQLKPGQKVLDIGCGWGGVVLPIMLLKIIMSG